MALQKKGISGTQVLSGDELSKEGRSLAQKAIIPAIPVPKEQPGKKIEETSGRVLKAASPIIDLDGNLLGALTEGVLLNRNFEIVDQIKKIVFKDAKYIIRIGNRDGNDLFGRFENLDQCGDKEGNRAIGTRAMQEVQEQVLGKGIAWIRRAYIVNDWYITA
jgi:two-component system NtrC family sensor kinase